MPVCFTCFATYLHGHELHERSSVEEVAQSLLLLLGHFCLEGHNVYGLYAVTGLPVYFVRCAGEEHEGGKNRQVFFPPLHNFSSAFLQVLGQKLYIVV